MAAQKAGWREMVFLVLHPGIPGIDQQIKNNNIIMKKLTLTVLAVAFTAGAAYAAYAASYKCSHCNGTGWRGQFKCAICGGDGDTGN